MIWQPRGKDATGADTHIGTNTRGTFLIASCAKSVAVYRLIGNHKVPQITRDFTDIADAKTYVEQL